ncbi:MAG: ExbD/TolR family protein [Planctomycetota bacterium]|jgi:biopolymer transport protein ExbD
MKASSPIANRIGVDRVVALMPWEVSVPHRSVALFTGLGVWIALCGACGEDELPRRDADGIALPVVSTAAPSVIPRSTVIKVTRDGRILFAGKGRSMKELLAALAREGSRGPFELQADRDALWMHVQWVMAALGQAGHKKVQCTVEMAESRRQGALELPLTRGLWEEKFSIPGMSWEENPDQLPVHLGTVVVLPTGDAADTGPATAEYHLLEGIWTPTGKSQDPEAVGTWAASFLKRASHEESFGVFFVIDAVGAVPYRSVVLALAALQKAGARGVKVGLEALHPWDRDRQVLPPPPHEDPIVCWLVTDLTYKALYPMNLPVASMCERDKADDPDDRVIVNLTATGRLIYKTKETTLAGLADHLKQAAQAYDRKMRKRGKQGHEETPDGRHWSKLYVLLRADRDTPWQQVRWVVAELAANGFYKVQFGARKTAGHDYTTEEAERRWAAQEIYGPVILDGKLWCFLPTRSSGPEENYLNVRVAGSPARYHFGGKETQSPEVLYEWIREAYRLRGERRTVGRIFAGPRSPFGEIVAAVNCFARAGMEKVDFAGIRRAPDDIRTTRLPQPQ